MTDENKHIIKLELPNFLDKALSPVANSIGNTLAMIWEGTFAGIESWAKSKKYQSEINLKKLMESLDKKFSEIPEENLQEPKMNILGPALESTKYFFEEEHYREMFANLISASADTKFNNNIHPSFAEVIKQLTHFDAKLLSHIIKLDSIPTVSIFAANDIFSGYELMNNFTEISATNTEYECYKLAIDNLVRLNLIDIPYMASFTDKSKYDYLKNSKIVNDYLNVFKQSKEIDHTVYKIELKEGVINLTNYGRKFISICLRETH